MKIYCLANRVAVIIMSSIKSQLVRFGGPIGGYRLCRFLTRSTPKILMYHRFSEKPKPGYVHREAFERQVDYLKRNFNLVTMGELVDAYERYGAFPGNAVVITVDDGYRDFYDVAYSVLKKHDVSATFYVTTRFVDGDFWLWPDAVKYVLESSGKIDLSKMDGSLNYPVKEIADDDRRKLWDMIIVYLLSINDDEKIQWINEFVVLQGVELPGAPIDDYSAVSWSQVKELDADNVEIGVHTQSHPSLGRLKESQLLFEIKGAVDIIQGQIGHAPKSFCFPNGQPSDYTETVKKYVKDAGCNSSVTAFYDRHITDDLFELRRFGICVSDGWLEFAKSVNGINFLMARWSGSNNIISG